MVYIDQTQCVMWVLCFLIIPFLMPLMIAILIYTSAFIFTIYAIYCKVLGKSYDVYNTSNIAAKIFRRLWQIHGRIWHGYEIRGLENIPESGPALIIFYHGALPVDIYYVMSNIFFRKNRILQIVAAYFLFKVPGLQIVLDAAIAIPGSLQDCLDVLKEGNLLSIAPGGTFESQFSHQYNLLWKNRLGFAKLALDAKVPIIPMFTENVREAYRTLNIGQSLFFKLYNATKFPFTPIYGGFPVKMVTYFGKPIPYDPQVSPEELKIKVENAVEELICSHQRSPPSILHALTDRIPLFRLKQKLARTENHNQ